MLDLRYALRTLLREPGFTLLAVLMLALGIGASTSIFSLVSAVLLRPLPFESPDQLVVLWEDFSSRGGGETVTPAPANFVDWRDRSTVFEEVAGMGPVTYNLTGRGEPERLAAIRTTANLFSLLGLQPVLGRTFTADDEGPNATPVAVVTEAFWIRRFGADPGLLGQSIVLDGLSHTVIGVVPSHFRLPSEEAEVWVPAAFTPEELAVRGVHYLYVVARLKPDIGLSQAQAEMAIINEAMVEEYPENTGLAMNVVPLHMELAREAGPLISILLGAVGIVLLIACANVANLLLARGAGRQRELALRQALGADRGRIVRQLLTESALLAAAALAIGVGLAALSFQYLARLVPSTFPGSASPGFDWRVLSFCAAITVLTVFLFGAGPALATARRDFNKSIKQGDVRGSVGGSGRMRSGLVVAEITLTVLLLAAAGLLFRSYVEVLTVDAGFRPQNLLVAETPLSPAQYAEFDRRQAFQERVLERVSAVPGVTSAGYVNYPPLLVEGGSVGVSIEGRPAPPPEEFARYSPSARVVSANYLATLGVPLISGRHFDERDVGGVPPTVVINQAMATLHWPGENAVGRRFKFGLRQSDAPWLTVVGVVGNVRQYGLDRPTQPELYLSHAQGLMPQPFFWPRHLIVRTDGDPTALAAAIRNAVWAVDPDQPVSSIRSMSDVFDAELSNRNVQLTLVGGFGALALILASVGLYGVLSFGVVQRTSEIGVRMALGAQPGNIVCSVVRRGIVLAAFGIVLGIVLAFGLTRLLSSFLFNVSPTDPVTLGGVSALLLLVVLVASYVPARRAADVDPASALRGE